MIDTELLIIGAGPAGMTAAIYASRKMLDFKIISLDVGGQTAKSWDVENYTGYQMLTGMELSEKFYEHLKSFGVEINMPESAQEIKRKDGRIYLKTDQNEYTAKAIIIATGKKPRKLDAEGEEQFLGKGVTYCATCDGPLFRGKDVAVIGGGNSALDAAAALARLCPKVYIINNGNRLQGDPVLIEKIRASKNIVIINDAVTRRIVGGDFVKSVVIERSGAEEEIQVSGVFVEIGLIPNSDFVKDVAKNEKGEIIVDKHNRTSVDGIFAAGDVTDVPEKQIIIASGEGAKAALSAFRYIQTVK